jgi:integrase
MKTYSAKEAPPPAEEREFPMEVRHKKLASVTIYQTQNRGAKIYAVAYPLDGKRELKMRREFEDAFSLAQQIALELGDGAPDVLTLSGPARFKYERAVEILSPLGLDLDLAASRFAEASKLAGGPEYLVEAARFYAETQKSAPPIKMVADVVGELIENRRSNGKSELYLRDLRVRLEQRFANAFRVPITSISTSDVEKFLADVKGRPRTKKNFLTVIGTLFSFAKSRGYLPDNHPGTSKVQFTAGFVREIQIFTPDEMSRLLAAAKPALVPALAICAFAGLRSEEVKRLEWSEVKIEENHIEVLRSISKTNRRRLPKIPDNLRLWLLPHRKIDGRVFPFANLAIQFAKLSKKCGVPWKKNGLRHSFISYRVAKVESAEKVALEAGNSAAVIHSNYLRMVTKAQANQWFAIKPAPSGNIIPMVRAAAAKSATAS